MRTTFANTIQRYAEKDPNIVLLSADLGFKVFDEFRERLPRQFIDMGVAEQNMISVAAGLAMTGKKVYCYSMVPFLVMRAFEQIRVDICNHKLDVTLVGVGGGLSYGMEGMTHHGFEDISIMRSLPGMTVTVPADPVECSAIINESITYRKPLFVRLGKNNDPVIHAKDTRVKIGKGIVLKNGKEVCLIFTGSMLSVAQDVVRSVKEKGIDPTIVSMHTIKPLDIELLKRMAAMHRALLTIEEHRVIGGLGSAVAEVLAETDQRCKFKRIGLPDKYCQDIGGHEFLKGKCKLSFEGIKEQILEVINEK